MGWGLDRQLLAFLERLSVGELRSKSEQHKAIQSSRSYAARNLKLEVDGVQVLDFDLELDPPFGQVGLFAWGDVGGAGFSNVTVTRQPE